MAFSSSAIAVEQSGNFKEFEVRVIRPRYFQKRGSFELGVKGMTITNQTFIYTFLGSLSLGYHFSESLGVEFFGASGNSILKRDTEILAEEFDINTQILRTQSLYAANMLWTPMYGKYQLSSGRVVYFDTALSVGLGVTGIGYVFDHCSVARDEQRRAAHTSQYATFSIGLGQRYYMNEFSALRWDLRSYIFNSDVRDGSCVEDPTASAEYSQQNNLTIELGYS
ncbi:MAG: outer membrane beta-barrel domain-containing protein, partial [Zetaproteobacteria bacterium]|nr:outer membrane beta-barrel domain-containing protein [Zetaproteobacteria bacterium]